MQESFFFIKFTLLTDFVIENVSLFQSQLYKIKKIIVVYVHIGDKYIY